MNRLCRPLEVSWREGTLWAMDLHVDTHVRYADPEAFFVALEEDCHRLAELWRSGALG